MPKIWVKNEPKLRDILAKLKGASVLLDQLSVEETKSGTSFDTTKALNTAFKELKALTTLFSAMTGDTSKAELRRLSTDVALPQSWKLFLRK